MACSVLKDRADLRSEGTQIRMPSVSFGKGKVIIGIEWQFSSSRTKLLEAALRVPRLTGNRDIGQFLSEDHLPH